MMGHGAVSAVDGKPAIKRIHADAANSFGKLASISVVGSVIAILVTLSVHLHYGLPAASPLPSTRTTPVFSEALAKTYIDHLAGDIGYRIVGTEELQHSMEYMLKALDVLKSEAHEAGSRKEMEIWHQVDDGTHLFEFMHKLVWKKYFKLSNVIVRVSDPSIPDSKLNSILVNAHIDSTLPSPGAADDLVGVAVMAEAIRVILNSPDWELYNSIIFLFNGAEESLQDGSHMFITKHPLKDTVRTVINLEACGITGAEVLFQATSAEMVKAYSKVPYPYGFSTANEIFGTGLMLSDTDFRQFEQYGNITGLDMALIENSYLYHTRQDTPKNLGPGALQHMGENTLALLKYLTSKAADMKNMQHSTDTVFFSGFGGLVFIMFSKTTAFRVYLALSIVALTVGYRIRHPQHRNAYWLAALFAPLSHLGGVVCSNIIATLLAVVFDKPMTWYKREMLPVFVFGPPTLLGQLGGQVLLSKLAPDAAQAHVLSHATLVGQVMYNSLVTVAGAWFNVGSAYLYALGMVSSTAMMMINEVLPKDRPAHVHLGAYLVAIFVPFTLGTEGFVAFLDIFVPLTGRMGHEPPVDHIVATFVSVMGFNILGVLVPFWHRFGNGFLRQFLYLTLIGTILVTYTVTRDSWLIFDETHPRRVPVLHVENITTTPPTFSLHVATIDGASGFDDLVRRTMSAMSIQGVPVMDAINDDVPDWDVIYPVSQHLKSWKVPLPSGPVSYASPWVERFKVVAVNNKLDHIRQQRSFTMTIDHPGLIWTVIAFKADVVKWDLPAPAERGQVRHHVKEISSYGLKQWTLDLTIQLNEREFEAARRNEQRVKGQRPGKFESLGQLKVDFSGLDELGLYPSKAFRVGSEERPGMAFFKQLDAKLPDYVDAMLLSSVASSSFV